MTSYDGTSTILLDVLASKPRLRLLRHLSTHEGSITGRALAQAAGVEAKRAAEALRELVNDGLVQRRRAGRAFLYSINRTNYVVDEILLPAFASERDWWKRLGEEIQRSIPGTQSVVLYGSWAKGRGRPESDVDLLLITSLTGESRVPRTTQETVDKTRARMSERYGKSLSLLIVSRDEFRRRLRNRDALARDIVAQGRVLAGLDLAEVAGGG